MDAKKNSILGILKRSFAIENVQLKFVGFGLVILRVLNMFKGSLGFKRWFKEVKCKSCKSSNILYDYSDKNYFCGICGEIQ